MRTVMKCIKIEIMMHPDREYFLDGDMNGIVWQPRGVKA